MPPVKDLISLTEAAEQSGIVRRTLQLHVKNGRVKGAQRIGNFWFVPKNFTVTPQARKPRSDRGKKRKP